MTDIRHTFIFLTAAVALTILGCNDTITNKYSTRKEAENDRLFERGWLPEILPQSSKDIVTINDLDSNTSSGDFHFLKGDSDDFIKALTLRNKSNEKGYSQYTYHDKGKVWTFLINKSTGHCKYALRHAVKVNPNRDFKK